jgi:hypothetical protein
VDDQEATRLNELVEALASDPGYASGKRKFLLPVSLGDAETIAAGLQDEVDTGVTAREAAIAAQGLTLACKRGCTGCCEEPIMVFRPEAVRVARWLKQPENAEARAAFLAAYPAWKAKVGQTPARLSELSPGAPEAYLAAHVAGWRQRVLCAFNRDGDCTIYPVRPITCRGGHALHTSERCVGSSPEPAARASFVPLERFIARTRVLLGATHNAVGGPRGRLEALPNIVHHMLQPRR